MHPTAGVSALIIAAMVGRQRSFPNALHPLHSPGLTMIGASLTWAGSEWLRFGRPSRVGLVTGTIAGLASVTPASGFIGPVGGVLIGIAGGAVCFYAVALIKFRLKIDDSLDVFAVHGVGGILGTLGLAFLALPTFGGLGLAEGAGAG